MKRIQPSEFVTKVNFSRVIEERTFDLTVHFTYFGEVLMVENHFSALPEAAQKLSLGENAEKKLQLLNLYIDLLSYFVPMAVNKMLKESNWSVFYKEIESLKKKTPELIFLNPQKSISDDWVKELYAKLKHSNGAEKFPFLIRLAKDVDKWDATSLQNLGFFKVKLAEPILLKGIPLLEKTGTLMSAYRTLRYFPGPKVLALLNQQLLINEVGVVQSTILDVLENYKDKETYFTLLNFYENNAGMQGTVRENFVKCIGHYRTPKSNEILLEILTGPSVHGGYSAFKVLKAKGMTEEDLVNKIYPMLNGKATIPETQNVLNIFTKIKDQKLIPPSEEILEIMVWANKKRRTVTINSLIPFFLKREINHNIYRRLMELLKDKKPAVREAALFQLSFIGRPEHLVAMVELLDDENEQVLKQALATLSKLHPKFSEPSLAIEKLLSVIERTKQPIKMEAMKVLSLFLNKTPDARAIPVLLKEVDHYDFRLRVEVAKAFAYFDEESAKKGLEKMKGDKNSVVLGIVRNSIKTIEDRASTNSMRKRLLEFDGKLKKSKNTNDDEPIGFFDFLKEFFK